MQFEDVGLIFAGPASAFSMYTNYLEIFLKCSLWLQGLEWRLRVRISYQSPGGAAADGPWTTLGVAKP